MAMGGGGGGGSLPTSPSSAGGRRSRARRSDLRALSVGPTNKTRSPESSESCPNSPLLAFGATLASASTAGRGRASSRVPVALTGNAAPAAAAESTPPPPQCLWCRRKKRTCDGETPCASCQKLELQCSYPLTTGLKRGPAAGVVLQLRGQLAGLQEQLRWVREQSAVQQEQLRSLAPAHHRAIQAFLAQLHTPRDQAAVHAYFFSVNNSLFPFLDRADFVAEHSRYAVEPTVQPPLVWILQYSLAVAIGATVSGEHAYAKSAASVARVVSCALFDSPSYGAVRGFLLLSYWLLGQNQHRRASCCLAIAKRMLFLVPMFHSRAITKRAQQQQGPGAGAHADSDALPEPLSTAEHVHVHEQLKLLLLFLEDMLTSSKWWKQGWSGVDELAPNSGRESTAFGARAPSLAVPLSSSLAQSSPTGTSSFLPSLFTTSAAGIGGASFGDLGADGEGLSGWSDLLVDKFGVEVDGADDSRELDDEDARSALMALVPDAKDFAYNRTNATSMRGGNPGLFEFPEAHPQAQGNPSGLFAGSTPMASVHLVDRKKMVLDAYAEQRRQELEASSGSSAPIRRKRKAQVLQDDSSESVNSDRTPSSASLYRPLPAPALLSAAAAAGSASAAAEVATSGSTTGGDLQLNLMRCMCTLSAIRGDVLKFQSDPNAVLLLHKCVSVLNEAERRLQQQMMALTSPALQCIRALVVCMKAVSLHLLFVLSGGGDSAGWIQTAKQASALTATVDLSFCPFFGAFFHAVSQLHLKHAQSLIASANYSSTSVAASSSRPPIAAAASTFKYLLLDLKFHERLASRWDFARPIFANLQQRVWGLLRGYNALPQPIDPTLLQLLSLSLPPVNSSGVNSNQIGGSLASDGSNAAPFVNLAHLDFSSASGGGGGGGASSSDASLRSGGGQLHSAGDVSGMKRSAGSALADTSLPPRKKHQVYPAQIMAPVPQMQQSYPLAPFSELSSSAMVAQMTNGDSSRHPSPALFPGAAAVTHRLSRHVDPTAVAAAAAAASAAAADTADLSLSQSPPPDAAGTAAAAAALEREHLTRMSSGATAAAAAAEEGYLADWTPSGDLNNSYPSGSQLPSLPQLGFEGALATSDGSAALHWPPSEGLELGADDPNGDGSLDMDPSLSLSLPSAVRTLSGASNQPSASPTNNAAATDMFLL